jgi:hypothetical protein
MGMMEFLGKKPPYSVPPLQFCSKCSSDEGCDCKEQHYKGALEEAANKIRNGFYQEECDGQEMTFFSILAAKEIEELLRISAGD